MKLHSDLVAEYIAKKMTDNELATFKKRLENEPDLKKQVVAMLVDLALQPNPLKKVRKIVDALGDDLFVDSGTVDDASEIPPTYTLDELLEFFSPAANLEAVAVSRGSELKEQNALEQMVILPVNDINVTGTSLLLVFENILTHPVHLEILNNKEQHVMPSIIIPAGVSSYDCKLGKQVPGKYYWRMRLDSLDRNLNREFGTAIGSFFINRQLL
ncbi:MAG TPA: hypothetical protein PK239_18105 [Chitinophagales bacterium]|nr:hypothetical protein [Chitinophagales bacterium]